MFLNIMVDSRHMWPEPYHVMSPTMNRKYTDNVKKPFTRTARPPKYYIIDFGISRRYSPDDPNPQETIVEGGDRTVPEFKNGHTPHDPFAVDIYYVGNVIREFILEVSSKSFTDNWCIPTWLIGIHRLRVSETSGRFDARA